MLFCAKNITISILFLLGALHGRADIVENKTDAVAYPLSHGVWTPFPKTDKDRERDYVKEILIATFDAEFDKLEASAEEAILKELKTFDGGWVIDDFLSSFSEYDSYNQVDPEVWQPVLEKRLKAWVDKYPQSLTATSAFSGFYADYAWAIVNQNNNNELTEKQQLMFEKRISTALDALGVSNESARMHPSGWTLYLAIGRPAGFRKEDVLKNFPEMQQSGPRYWHLYASVIHQYLLPWHQGSNNSEWHEWLVSALEAPALGDLERDSIYARIVLSVMHGDFRAYRFANLYEEMGLDWHRLQRGARNLLTTYPESTRLPTYYLTAAVIKGDEPAIREALSLLKPHYDRGLWSGVDDEEFFRLLEDLRIQYPNLADILN